MAAAIFAKRAKPGSGANASRRRLLNSDSEGDDAADTEATTSAGLSTAKRRPLLLGSDEEPSGDAFQVKKSKASRKMSSRTATAPPKETHGLRGGLRSSASSRRLAKVSRESLEIDDASSGEHLPPQSAQGHGERAADQRHSLAAAAPASEVEVEGLVDLNEEGDESEGERQAQTEAAQAARLARAQRAAARELQGGGRSGVYTEAAARSPPQPDYIPLVASQAQQVAGSVASEASSRSELAASTLATTAAGGALCTLGLGPDPEDAADAWALQQMRLGAHRRYTGAMPARAPPSATASEPAPGTVMSGAGLRKRGRSGPGSEAAAQATEEACSIKAPGRAMAQLWETVARIEGGVGDRATRSEQLDAQREEAASQLKRLEEEAKGLSEALKAVQELETLSWGLGGLLDSKAPKLKQATQTLGRMEQDFAVRRTRRRAVGIARALRAAGAALSAPTPASEVEEDEDSAVLAAAELLQQERRRLRRKRRRAFREGWDTSSMSEADGLAELVSDRAAFCAAAEKQITADVAEDFATASAVLQPLTRVKDRLKGEYVQAYLPQSLPEALACYVGHSLLWWDPLDSCPVAPQRSQRSTEKALPPEMWGPRCRVAGTQLESFEWFGELAAFTELQGEADPDASLVPRLVGRCVFPEVARRLRECWDVTSAHQSARVASLLDECLLFEVEPEASSFAGLLEAAHARLEQGLAELAPEVFVPRDAMAKWYASEARRRWLWRSCKLAHCALLLEGRLPDEDLSRLVLGRVVAARLLPHLQAPRLDSEEMALLERLATALPQRWLQDGLPQALGPIRDALGPRAPSSREAATTAEAAVRILRSLRCFDEAQALLACREA